MGHKNISRNIFAKDYLRSGFYLLSALLGLFVAMEAIKPRIVTAYLDINRILLLWLVSGIILLFWNGSEDRSDF